MHVHSCGACLSRPFLPCPLSSSHGNARARCCFTHAQPQAQAYRARTCFQTCLSASVLRLAQFKNNSRGTDLDTLRLTLVHPFNRRMDPPSTSSVPLTRIHWQSNTTSAPRHLRCCSASAWYAHRAQPFHIRLRCHDSMIIKQESDIRSSRRRLSRLPEPRQRQVTWLGRWSLIITPCLKSRRTEVSLAR